jgi:hypothetical protein
VNEFNGFHSMGLKFDVWISVGRYVVERGDQTITTRGVFGTILA